MGNSTLSKEEVAEYKEKYGLSKASMQKTAKEWEKATNGTFTMTLPEFVKWCKRGAPNEADERFERLFKIIDRDKSGSIDVREILLVEGMQHLSGAERIPFVFELYDEDKDGVLTEKDISLMATELFKSYPEISRDQIIGSLSSARNMTSNIMLFFGELPITVDNLVKLYYRELPIPEAARTFFGNALNFWEYLGLHFLFLTTPRAQIQIESKPFRGPLENVDNSSYYK